MIDPALSTEGWLASGGNVAARNGIVWTVDRHVVSTTRASPSVVIDTSHCRSALAIRRRLSPSDVVLNIDTLVGPAMLDGSLVQVEVGGTTHQCLGDFTDRPQVELERRVRCGFRCGDHAEPPTVQLEIIDDATCHPSDPVGSFQVNAPTDLATVSSTGDTRLATPTECTDAAAESTAEISDEQALASRLSSTMR